MTDVISAAEAAAANQTWLRQIADYLKHFEEQGRQEDRPEVRELHNLYREVLKNGSV